MIHSMVTLIFSFESILMLIISALTVDKPSSRPFATVSFRQRPYFVEYTRSHPNSEVKRRKARSVLGWGTAREALRVLLAFYN